MGFFMVIRGFFMVMIVMIRGFFMLMIRGFFMVMTIGFIGSYPLVNVDS